MRVLKRCMGGVAIGLTLGSSIAAGAQTVTAIPKLELKQLTGTWYEIAAYPDKKSKKCVADAVALFSEKNKRNQFEVVNSCRMKNGFSQVRNGDGKVADKSGDGKLKVTYLWPFYRKYWVLAGGPEYNWALVGNPNHKNLWILSKSATMKPELLAEIEAKASSEGFDPGKLKMVPQGR